MKGYSEIPALHAPVLRRLTLDMAKEEPALRFSSKFATVRNATDEVEWEIELGSTGMAPFTVPGSPAPVVGIDGFTSGHAKVAYWAEKSFMDELFLNNLRRVGTLEQEAAQQQLGRQLRKLINRSNKRKEWMCAKAIIDGYFTYVAPGKAGTFTVNYGRPAENDMVLLSDRKWGTGAQRNPIEDLYNAKTFMADMYGLTNLTCIMNTNTLHLALMDAKIQDLLKKSAFGNGDLFSNPAGTIGSLLGVGTIAVNDEGFEVEAFVMSASETTVIVDDASQFEVGGTARYRASHDRFDGSPIEITAVDPLTNTITLKSPIKSTVTPGRDKLVMRKKLLADNKVILMAEDFMGIRNEFYLAPFGIPPHFDLFTDTWEERDPDGVYLRVQNKGMPVVYHPQTVYTLTVA